MIFSIKIKNLNILTGYWSFECDEKGSCKELKYRIPGTRGNPTYFRDNSLCSIELIITFRVWRDKTLAETFQDLVRDWIESLGLGFNYIWTRFSIEVSIGLPEKGTYFLKAIFHNIWINYWMSFYFFFHLLNIFLENFKIDLRLFSNLGEVFGIFELGFPEIMFDCDWDRMKNRDWIKFKTGQNFRPRS